MPQSDQSKLSTEVERKWLADLSKIPTDKIEKSSQILQGYLSISSTSEDRIRSKDNSYYRTIKKDISFTDLKRSETEYEITKEEFEKLWPSTHGKRIIKTRHIISLEENLKAEIDIFEAGNIGLVLIEVEFESESKARSFTPPPWFGTEVTENRLYRNKALAN